MDVPKGKMATRPPLTEVSWIACDDLQDLGAGEKEGWLSSPSLIAALRPGSVALANSSTSIILILSWDPGRSSSSSLPRSPIKIYPSLSRDDGSITALEWLAFGDDLHALAVGTSAGYLLVYSENADLMHKQFVHPGRVLRLRFREGKRDVDSEELCVVMPGVIVRFEGSDVQNALRRWFQGRASRAVEDEESYGRIPFQLWDVSKYGMCADGSIVGLMPPPLLELQSSQRYYCAVTIGDDAVVSAYRLSEDRSRSIVGAILSKVVPATFSTIASFSKMIWRSEQKSKKKPSTPTQSFAKASPVTCLKDPPRKGEKLTLSPSGALAAITDSLGRILLLDTQALVVVRLWKGYRDACCLFMEMLVSRDKASSSSVSYKQTRSDYFLCLAIHAPRKGIIEIWKMRTGPRLVTVECPKGSKILQPSVRSASSDSPSYKPLEVFLLNGDSGQLSVLNKSIG